MIRPTAPDAHRVNASELAKARSQRAAAIARRQAAGRRRALISFVLMAAAVTFWTRVAGGNLAWGWAVPLTALAAGAVFLSVRASVADRAANARTRGEIARLDQRLRLFRVEDRSTDADAGALREPTFEQILEPYRAAHAAPVDAATVVEEAPKHARPAAPSVHVGLSDADVVVGIPVDATRTADNSWSPTPVPLPAYTLKAEAPKREIAAFEAEPGPSARVPERPTASAPYFGTEPLFEEEQPVAQTFDLSDILARRRASGA